MQSFGLICRVERGGSSFLDMVNNFNSARHSVVIKNFEMKPCTGETLIRRIDLVAYTYHSNTRMS